MVGECGTLHGQRGVWITDQQYMMLQSLEHYVTLGVRLSPESENTYICLDVSSICSNVELARLDPSRRAEGMTFVPYVWLIGERVGY